MTAPALPPNWPPAGFAPNNNLTGCIQDPQDLIDCFNQYEIQCQEDGKPLSLNAFLAYAQRPLGITRRWWGRQSRGDKDCAKLPGLREAVEGIETRIAGRLDEDGLSGKIQPTMAGNILHQLDSRDALVAQRAADAAAFEERFATIAPDKSRIANIMHPDMSIEQQDAYYAAGIEPPLYSQQQLEMGMPFYPCRSPLLP